MNPRPQLLKRLDQAWRAFEDSYAGLTPSQLLAYLATLPDSQLTAKSRLRHRLRMDTYSHYPHHTAAILKWRQLLSTGT